MLAPAASFTEFVLGIHILAVVVSFGLLFVYPLLGVIGARLEPGSLPAWHRLQLAVHTRIAAPGLGVIFLAGVILASEDHQWSKFYVGWGIAASLAIGAVGGAYLVPRERRLIELAGPEPDAEYLAVSQQVERGRLLQAAIAAVTIFFMALHLGA